MIPAARVQAAIEVLDAILDGVAAEKALTNWARRSRFAGSSDRAAIRDRVFQALRCKRSYARLGGQETGRGLMIGALRDQSEALEAVFTGARFAPAPLTDDEMIVADLTEADQLDLPDWLALEFQLSLGEHAAPAAHALRERAPVMVRVNTAKADIQQAIAALRQEGITAQADPIAETALKLTEGARRLAIGAAYQTGLVELQDGSSQAAMELVELPETGAVLDYCAGGGGKSLALAARGAAALKWYAHDSAPDRMKDLPERAARAGINVSLLTNEALAANGLFEVVLCDVPCSGSGTWRRAPEAKWALTPERLQKLTTIQRDILRDAMALVAPGGLLVYATCSILNQENKDQTDRFLHEHPNWSYAIRRSWSVSASGDGFYLAGMRCKNT